MTNTMGEIAPVAFGKYRVIWMLLLTSLLGGALGGGVALVIRRVTGGW